MTFETLSEWADQEIKALLSVLPEDIQESSKLCKVSFEPSPAADSDPDEISSFEGNPITEAPDPETPAHIRIFLQSIWEAVENDEDDFRDEVGTTFLQEIGYFLGWDEEEEEHDTSSDLA